MSTKLRKSDSSIPHLDCIITRNKVGEKMYDVNLWAPKVPHYTTCALFYDRFQQKRRRKGVAPNEFRQSCFFGGKQS